MPPPVARPDTSNVSPRIVVGVPLLLFCAHAWFFRGWIIDDAGISYAYARNLANGAGLVAQPGVAPVEGYSDPAWVFLLALFFRLGIFDPVILPKVLATAFVAMTFVLLRRALVRLDLLNARWHLVLLALIGTNTSFVLWCTSGLENPLLCMLAALLFFIITSAVERDAPGRFSALAAGAVAALLGLTRPDGALYFLAFPATVALAAFVRARAGRRVEIRWLPELAKYLAPFGAIWGGHLLFRFRYFGQLVPNTYNVKGGPTIQTALSVLSLGPDTTAKLHELTSSIAYPVGGLLMLALPLTGFVLVIRRRLDLSFGLLALFTLHAAAAFVLLPSDWMGEYRFATVFIVFGLTTILVLAHRGFPLLASYPSILRPARSVAVVAAIAYVGASAHRTVTFLERPTLSFQRVQRGREVQSLPGGARTVGLLVAPPRPRWHALFVADARLRPCWAV